MPFRTITRALPAERFAISSVTAAELLVGVDRANSPQLREQRVRIVERVLSDLPVLPYDLPVARIHARLWAQLAMAGTIIGDRDLMIAATALTHGYDVLTHNVRHFARVPGLVVWQPDW